jgi:hypothetical protein
MSIRTPSISRRLHHALRVNPPLRAEHIRVRPLICRVMPYIRVGHDARVCWDRIFPKADGPAADPWDGGRGGRVDPEHLTHTRMHERHLVQVGHGWVARGSKDREDFGADAGLIRWVDSEIVHEARDRAGGGILFKKLA